jgi:hypothetical protein
MGQADTIVAAGCVLRPPRRGLTQGFQMALPLPLPFLPMEALSVDVIPVGREWHYEPKWDGFRALVDVIHVVSSLKSSAPLHFGRFDGVLGLWLNSKGIGCAES